jgi:hypothetical protein
MFNIDVAAPRARFTFECLGSDGQLKWSESFDNLVTTAGKTDLLDKYLKGASYTAGWFLLLKGTGTVAAGDTLASHAGWSEVNPYTGNRPGITWGTTTAGSNTATTVSFSITSAATVAGAGICTVSSGTSGLLYNAGDFTSGSKAVDTGDTLNVTITLTVT